jgi:hypothetical protein
VKDNKADRVCHPKGGEWQDPQLEKIEKEREIRHYEFR